VIGGAATPRTRFAAALAVVVLLVPHPGRADVPSPAPRGAPPAMAASLGIGGAVSSALVEAATGQVLIVGDGETRRPIASAIKLVTALAVVEALPAGSMILVGEEVVGIEGSSFELRPGDVRSVEDLLAGLLLRSGNDAAVALAVAVDGTEAAFIDRMEDTLVALGVAARPGSASGLEPADALSALELAIVARAALAEPRIRTLVGLPAIELADGTVVENRNLFLGDTEGATGLKTGFTSFAGFTLAASARREGRELVAVVLGAEDDRHRREVAARLLEHGFTTTALLEVEPSLTLRTSTGPVRFRAGRTALTVADGTVVGAAWPRTLRPDDRDGTVGLIAEGAVLDTVPFLVEDQRRSVAVPTLGRALADGAYAVFRVHALSEGMERPLR